jgi:hypothetical protein
MVETTSTPIREPSPLSRPKAAFNGHTGFPPSLKFNDGEITTDDAYEGVERDQEPDDDAIGQDPSWEPEVYSMGKC